MGTAWDTVPGMGTEMFRGSELGTAGHTVPELETAGPAGGTFLKLRTARHTVPRMGTEMFQGSKLRTAGHTVPELGMAGYTVPEMGTLFQGVESMGHCPWDGARNIPKFRNGDSREQCFKADNSHGHCSQEGTARDTVPGMGEERFQSSKLHQQTLVTAVVPCSAL